MDELHENTAGVELALSLSVTVNENAPKASGGPELETVVPDPVELLRASQEGPARLQEYGGSPPAAPKEADRLRGRLRVAAGQLPLIVNGAIWTVKEHV